MRTARRNRDRRGTVLPLLALSLTAMFTFVALAIDVGVLTVGRTQCQSAADGAALAATRMLNNRPGDTAATNNGNEALAVAKAVLTSNKLLNSSFEGSQVGGIRLGVYDYSTGAERFVSPNDPSAAAGAWDSNVYSPGDGGEPSAGTPPAGKSWSAVEVKVSVSQTTYFSKLMGITTLPNGARALAVHRPRDIAFVLDYSGSMGFGSVPSWPYYESNARKTYEGLHNPDTKFPLFGHYGRYAHYAHDRGETYNIAAANPRERPHPFRRTTTQPYVNSGNDYALGPNNHTAESNGGPPMLEGSYTPNGGAMLAEGFVTAAGNPNTINSGTEFYPAFTWVPPRTAPGNSASYTPATYDFTDYDAFSTAEPDVTPSNSTFLVTAPGSGIATPAPPNFGIQSDTPVAYVGDKAPRVDGGHGPPATTTTGDWATLSANTFTDNWAKSLQEYLNIPDFPLPLVDGQRQVIRTVNGSAPARNFIFPGSTAVYGALLPNGSTGPNNADVVTTGTFDGGDGAASFRDAIWEKYGYDLNVGPVAASDLAYRADGSLAGGDGWQDGLGALETAGMKPVAERFKGYSMGPGYWGKTFFTWPPDPRWGNPNFNPAAAEHSVTNRRALGTGVQPDLIHATDGVKDSSGNWICDWRRRFFLRGDGAAFDPQVDQINRILFLGTAGHVLNPIATSVSGTNTGVSPNVANTISTMPGYYQINYKAVLAWLKSGPRVLPGNVRAGRYVYYKTIPDNVDVSGSAGSDVNLDKRFWREYIHFVLGVGQFSGSFPVNGDVGGTRPDRALAGVEVSFNLPPSITQTTNFNPIDGGLRPDAPRPYMACSDQINRPRAHFWFGPMTWLHIIEHYGSGDRAAYAGTVKEAQCWQLKAAMSSVLDDIRVNHPNDFCGLSFFAGRAEFQQPRAPMSQDWFTLKNALYFRREAVNILKEFPDDPVEYRMYDSNLGIPNVDLIPNSRGGTDPNTALAVAYNLLSSSNQLTKTRTITSPAPANNRVSNAPVYGDLGRRGAAKIVLFETDGVPTGTRDARYTVSGANTFFAFGSGTTPSTADISFSFTGTRSSHTNAARAALAVVRIICAQTTAAVPGHSSPGVPARVYAIGFGDIFDGWPTINDMTGQGQDAHRFLLAMQQTGNTSGPTDTTLPQRQIISGTYQNRIDQMRDALERIFQSGVQVTLLE